MRTRSLARPWAVVLALSQSGCSIFLMQAPPSPPIDRPDAPIECSDSILAPAIDTALAVAMIGIGISAFVGPKSSPANGWGSLATAAIFGVPACIGYGKRDRCEAFKAENSACISGNEAACLRLNPKWAPPPGAFPSSTPTSPTTAAATP